MTFFKKIIASYNNFRIKIPSCFENEINNEIKKTNIRITRFFLTITILIEVLISIVYSIKNGLGFFEVSKFNNLYLYYILIIICVIYFFIILQIEKIENIKMQNFTEISLIFIYLFWGMIVGLIDIANIGNTIVYQQMFFLVSLIPFIKPSYRAIVYISVHSIYVFLLFRMNLPNNRIFPELINSSITVLMGFIISTHLYYNKINNFLTEKTIMNQNKDLIQLNEELITINEELEMLSNIDSLTQVYNKRKIYSILEDEWNKCMLSSCLIGCIIIDIDHFKIFNDTYGHLYGDKCLESFGINIKPIVYKNNGFIGRFGGEEFLLIFSNTNKDRLINIAEEIQSTVKNIKLKDIDNFIHILTISLGIACIIPNENLIPRDLIKEADIALYQAKNKGRDRIEFNEMS